MTAATTPLRRDVKVIGLISVAHGLSHFYQLVVAVLFPLIKDDLGVSYAALGVATAVYYTVSGVCQTLAGFAVDRFGARRVLLIGLALCSLGILLAGLAQSYAMLMIAFLVAGLGNSVFHPADFAILNARVDASRLGYAFSFHGIGGTLGWALAPAFGYGLAALADWHTALVAAAALGVVMIVLILASTDAVPGAARGRAQPAPAPTRFADDVRVLAAPAVLMCFLYFLLLAAALIGVQNFGVAGLVALYDAPVALASSALTAFLVGGAAGILTGGYVAGRTRRHDLVAAGGMLASAAAVLVLASGALSQALLAPMLALAGFASGLTNPSRDLLVRGATPPGASGKVYGFVYSGLDVGSMATPVLYGWMLDRALAAGVFYTVFAMLLLTVATVLYLPTRATAVTRTA
ncbi:MAG: MFS transporter [Burkholderiales bacterium]|nr:MFS transporter [Burkholderiales bacterium]